MAITPEELEQVKLELQQRMGASPALGKEMAPGAKPANIDAAPGIGEMEGGGMGFGGVNAAKQQGSQLPEYNPNEGFNFNPAAGTEGGGAMGGLASGLSGSMSIAKALRGKGKEPFGGIKGMFADKPQMPETTPLPD